jgi:hypothetical protein
MSDLTEFLLARVAEEEQMAVQSLQISLQGANLVSLGKPDAPPIMILHPDRVMAECEAKRHIAERTSVPPQMYAEPEELAAYDEAVYICRILAAIYDEHPDYDEAWRP